MNKKTLTLEESEEMFRSPRTLYLQVDPDGSSAQLFDHHDLYVTKEDWLQIRKQVDAFFAYLESEESINTMTLEEMNQRRVEIVNEVLRRKVGIKP